MNFLVTDALIAYNAILGQLTLMLSSDSDTYLLLMQFELDDGVVEGLYGY